MLKDYLNYISVASGLQDRLYGFGAPYNHVPSIKSKGEQAKCKSCVHCIKINRDYYCSKHAHSYISPMQTACNDYGRKKK